LDILGTCSGASKDAVSVQTGKLVKSFDVEQRTEIIKNAQIPSASIPEDALVANALVAMKVDMGIPWEKLKTMSR